MTLTLTQSAIQSLRTQLNQAGYAFWFDAENNVYRLNLMGDNTERYRIHPYQIKQVALDIVRNPAKYQRFITEDKTI